MEEPANMDSVEKAARNDDEVMLPGFRFHPTDEELVGFYLRRKVEKKAIRLEIIKQIDIYKYDPWDLPKVSGAGDKEWYFFCIRGRKYRNSIRPNRVTGSGFWKATGIDKPIYTVKEPHQCIGLKKSLVYYRGSAGKGTKTDWMMHEFRLPPPPTDKHNVVVPTEGQQPEVWTLCRIFKRIPSIHKKYAEAAAATWKDSSRIEQKLAADVDRGLICSNGSLDDWDQTQSYSINEPCMSFCDDSSSSAVLMRQLDPKVKPDLSDQVDDDESNNFIFLGQWSTTNSIAQHHHQAVPSFSASNNIYPASVWDPNGEIDVFPDGNWDELRSVVEFAIEPYPPRIFS